MNVSFPQSVTATQLVRDLASIRTMVTYGPVGITSHNRTELVVLSAHRFGELTKSTAAADAGVLDAKLTTVLESIDTHVVILDRNLQVLRINRPMRLVFGIEIEDVRGTLITDLLPPTSSPFILKRIREVMASGKIAEFDIASSIRPGRTVHARLIPWPGGIIYLAEDITDRISGIERELEFSAVRSAYSAFGGLGSGSIDETGIVLSADDGLGKMLGAAKDSVASLRFVSLFDPAHRGQIENAIATSGDGRVLDVSYLRKGVCIVQARLALSPFHSGGGYSRRAFVVQDSAFSG